MANVLTSAFTLDLDVSFCHNHNFSSINHPNHILFHYLKQTSWCVCSSQRHFDSVSFLVQVQSHAPMLFSNVMLVRPVLCGVTIKSASTLSGDWQVKLTGPKTPCRCRGSVRWHYSRGLSASLKGQRIGWRSAEVRLKKKQQQQCGFWCSASDVMETSVSVQAGKECYLVINV